ncbi:MAG: PilZ domain-containing protein [Alphaproteobacteria bacterium]|nr:PilZ domain-containing protein [Alphaproteobacteria bacterium]
MTGESASDRRRFTRHDVSIPVRIKDGGRGIEAETVNISGCGLALKLESSLLAGSKVKVEIGELGEFAADIVAVGDTGRLRLDISETEQAQLADEIVRKLAHLMPV